MGTSNVLRFDWRTPLKIGLLGGLIALLVSLVGMVEASHVRPVITGLLSLGQTLLLLVFVFASATAVRRTLGARERGGLLGILNGAIAGLLTSAVLVALVLIGGVVNLRAVLIRASPTLYDLLTLGLGQGRGSLALLLLGLVLGAMVGAVYLLPERPRRAVMLGAGLVPTVAILSSALFAGRGLSFATAVIIFVAASGLSYLWSLARVRLSDNSRPLPLAGQMAMKWGRWALVAAVVLLYPLLGKFPSEVLDNVGLYVLMGLGLNIVVGFAGLLDLGYVAFFALGAYTMGILTSPEIGWLGPRLSFWAALPFAVLIATLSGVLLGIPVLGMRGDYLAIVTLGFGEIIRLVVLSDWLKPYIGGSNGITRIPKPALGPLSFATPQTLYYLLVAGCVLAGFVAIRLKDSRLGRAWMAMREDEDVAQAMGIDLVKTKLLAFASGAAFSGLSGAIFATKLTSVYPHSFHVLVSINALCVIIVGGMGSIPGVIAGALALVGLPELLREFAEYRLLVYGAALVMMMLRRPEGLMPEARRRLELHEAESSTSA